MNSIIDCEDFRLVFKIGERTDDNLYSLLKILIIFEKNIVSDIRTNSEIQCQ